MSSTISRIVQAIKPHVPLIKFRKGSLSQQHVAAAAATPVTPMSSTPSEAAAVHANPSAAAEASSSAGWKTTQFPVREWWDTPPKFKRREVDDLEIDIINGGGCDQLYQ